MLTRDHPRASPLRRNPLKTAILGVQQQATPIGADLLDYLRQVHHGAEGPLTTHPGRSPQSSSRAASGSGAGRASPTRGGPSPEYARRSPAAPATGAAIKGAARKFAIDYHALRRHWRNHVSAEARATYIAGPAAAKDQLEEIVADESSGADRPLPDCPRSALQRV